MRADFVNRIQEMLVEGLLWLLLIGAYALVFLYLFVLATEALS